MSNEPQPSEEPLEQPTWPEAPTTGHPGIDAALRTAATHIGDPGEQLAALAKAHQQVADILASSPQDQVPIPGMEG